jgi:hypothetical protein
MRRPRQSRPGSLQPCVTRIATAVCYSDHYSRVLLGSLQPCVTRSTTAVCYSDRYSRVLLGSLQPVRRDSDHYSRRVGPCPVRQGSRETWLVETMLHRSGGVAGKQFHPTPPSAAIPPTCGPHGPPGCWWPASSHAFAGAVSHALVRGWPDSGRGYAVAEKRLLCRHRDASESINGFAQ